MALLPRIPRRGEILQGPQSRVGPGTVATPYRVLGEALDRAGQTLTTWATEEAVTAGQNAVTRDENGNLTVRRMSNLTQVGRAYNRAAQQAYLARLSNDIRTSAQQFAMEANGNVETFDAAWAGFTQQTLQNVNPDLQGAVTAMLEEVGGQQYRGISASRYESDMGEYRDTLVAERARIYDQLSTLAFSGGLETPDAQSLIAQYHDLGNELAGNPAFGIAEEAQDWADEQALAFLQIDALRGEVERRFAVSPAGAQEYIDQVIMDPDLPFSAEERLSLRTGLLRQLDASTAEYRQAQTDYRTNIASPLLTLLRDTQLPYDVAEAEQAIQRGLEVGDFTTVAEIQHWVRFREVYASGDLLEAYQLHAQITGGGAVVDRIIAIESGGNASAVNPNSSATGLGQFIESTWIDMVNRHRPDLLEGRTQAEVLALRTDPAISRELTAAYAEENRQALAARGLPQTAGNIYLAHFLGPRGAIALLSTEPSRPVSEILGADVVAANANILSGKTAGDVIAWASNRMGEFAVPPDILAAERGALEDELRLMAAQAETIVENHIGLDANAAAVMVDYALAVNDPALTQRVSDIVADSMTNNMVNGLTAQQGEALLAELATGVAGDQYLTARAQQRVEANLAHQAELLEDNPYLYGVEQGLYRNAPLDVADNQALAAGLPVRQQNLAAVAQIQGGTYGLLQPEEAAALAQRFAAATPEEKVEILATVAGAISNPDALMATMAQLADGEGRVLAMAGAIYQDSPEMAALVVRGQALMALEPDRAPSDANWRNAVEAQLPRSSFAPGSTEQYVMLSEAALYAYVALRAQASGDQATVSQPEFERALAGITGGTVTFNGQKIIAPVYGMTQREFDDLINSEPEWLMMGRASFLTGDAFTWEDLTGIQIMGEPVHLKVVGEGRYLIQLGPDTNPLYVADRGTGRPFELNLARGADPDDPYLAYTELIERGRGVSQSLNAQPPLGQPEAAAPATIRPEVLEALGAEPGSSGPTLREFFVGAGWVPETLGELTRDHAIRMRDLGGGTLAEITEMLADVYGVTVDEIVEQMRP